MDKKQLGHDIIVVGGSTGATPPLRALLANLPAALEASVFVSLHMSARSTGILRTVASAISHLPVSSADDGMRIQAGHVYLAVPNRHLILTPEGIIRLGHGPRENMARPAIDALFRSAAAAFGHRVIGVLLSGLLNDGVAGLETIKRCGGLAVVQSPDDAAAAEMPHNAIAAVAVDHVVSTDQLGSVVTSLASQAPGPPVPTPEDIRLEVAIATDGLADTEVEARISRPAPLTCPTCGGVLSQVNEHGVLRFRCQIGHAMTAQVLEKEQRGRLDQALAVALRVVEERTELLRRMARDNRASERDAAAEIYEDRIAEYERYGEILRRAVTGGITP